LSQQIAEFIWPADGHGNPLDQAFSGTTIDWANGRVFLWNGTYVRGYNIGTFQTFNPYATAAWPAGVLTTVCGVRTTWDGYIIVSTSGYQGVSKLDPLTLAEVARFGAAGGSYPSSMIQFSNSYDGAMGCIEVNGVGYCLGRELIFGHGGLIRTDNMTAAGFYQTLSGGWFGNGMVCGGASGASSGSFYCIDAYDNVANPAQVNLYKIIVTAGAENYNIASWPTPNPNVSYSLLNQITGPMVDASWTTIETQSIGYDARNNIILVAMTQYAGSDQRLVGINGDTGDVIWSLNPFSGRTWSPDLSQSRVSSGYITLVSNGNLFSPFDSLVATVNTATGAVVNTTTVYGIGTIFRSFSSDDVTGGWLGCVNYSASTTNSPTAVSGTPSSFQRQSMIQPLVITPSTLSLGDLQVREVPDVDRGEVTLRWSDDAGASWSSGLLKSLGDLGEFRTDVSYRRLGMARNRIFEVSWSGAIAEALQGVNLVVEFGKT